MNIMTDTTLIDVLLDEFKDPEGDFDFGLNFVIVLAFIYILLFSRCYILTKKFFND